MTGVKSLANAGLSKRATVSAVCLLSLFVVMSMVFASAAFADEKSAASADGKSAASDAKRAGAGLMIGNDYLWAGESGNIAEESVENDILAAGRTVRITEGSVGGSVRAAGQSVILEDVEVTENVSIAGETTSVDGGSANAVCMAAKEAVFTGECEELHAYAETIVINGTVHGDARVAGSSVEIGPDAVVEGTLHVTASAEPDVPATAKIGKLDVKIEDGADVSSEQVSGVLAGLASAMFVLGIIVSIVGTLLIAVLAEWLFRRHTAAAAEMIRARTGATIGSGIVGALVAPIAIVILCCLVITLPVAGALALALLAMSLVAAGFMGASVFKLAFPNLGRFKTALAGGAIMGVASAIPFLGSLVGVVAFMYFLGYVLQTVFLSLCDARAERSSTTA